jgi:hypothetical protein
MYTRGGCQPVVNHVVSCSLLRMWSLTHRVTHSLMCSITHSHAGSLVIQREGPQGLGPEEVLGFDECLWCTQAAAPAWLKETGLPTGR